MSCSTMVALAFVLVLLYKTVLSVENSCPAEGCAAQSGHDNESPSLKYSRGKLCRHCYIYCS